MPIVSSDIRVRLSGGATNTDKNASIGGAKSSTEVANTVNNLFDIVMSAEGTTGSVKYRCVYVHNQHATLTLQIPVVFINADSTGSDSTVSIGVGSSAVGETEPAIANETTAPSGVSFSQPIGEENGLDIGELAPGEHRAVWIRRTISEGASAINNDTVILGVKGDTAA